MRATKTERVVEYNIEVIMSLSDGYNLLTLLQHLRDDVVVRKVKGEHPSIEYPSFMSLRLALEEVWANDAG